MSKHTVILVLLMSLLAAYLPAIVNGDLEQIGNKYILHVWGNHYERGYATGYLLGPNILEVFSNYFYTNVTGGSPGTYNYYLQFHNDNYLSNDRYVSEAVGMIAGISASGTSIYHSGLQRDLTYQDILFVNAIVDISGMMQGKDLELGCSSLSSWGQATTLDPFLQGGIVITRLLDWTRHNTLVNNPLLVVHHPSEPDERKWISFTYPGLFGALSGIADNSAAAFLNMGNIHTHTSETGLTNVLFDIRSGLERLDINNDGVSNTEDLFYALSSGKHIGGTIIHNVHQWADSSRAAIIETNNSGTARRLHNQDSGLNGDNLAATNHFRSLYNPVYCYRYSRLIDSLSVNPIVSAERQITIIKGAGGVSTNLMMIQYQSVTGDILWSVAAGYSPAYTQEPLLLNTAQLFVQPTSLSDEYMPSANSVSLFPNPLKTQQQLQIRSSKAISELAVYNLRGQSIYQTVVNANECRFNPFTASSYESSGVYLIKLCHIDGSTSISRFIHIK